MNQTSCIFFINPAVVITDVGAIKTSSDLNLSQEILKWQIMNGLFNSS